jgi:hypothetical protein
VEVYAMPDRAALHHLRDLLTAAQGYVRLAARELREAECDRERLSAFLAKADEQLAAMDAQIAEEMEVPRPDSHTPTP